MPYGMGGVRSNFLIHWTGKDINTDYRALCDAQREEYVARLRSTLRKDSNGLWMKENEEEITIPGVGSISYKGAPMTCFTEIKLSATYEHAKRYGCLGLGFTRDFVIGLLGAPVQYVAATVEDEIAKSMIIVMNNLRTFSSKETTVVQLSPVIAEEVDPEFHQLQWNDGLRAMFENLFNTLKINMLLLKPMSECTCPHDFQNLDEAEWRILHETGGSQDKIIFDGKDKEPPARITFEPADLKIIVFPDDHTRSMALSDQVIMDWFGDPPDLPVMTTIEECLQF